ncbi:MAG TPA: hypothetical protein VK139_04005 [Microbacteriaceae bacterium]|nr:hypothetical protein [Microbacteriaceae bacterium]
MRRSIALALMLTAPVAGVLSVAALTVSQHPAQSLANYPGDDGTNPRTAYGNRPWER